MTESPARISQPAPTVVSTVTTGLVALPARVLLGAIWLYRRLVSPVLPAVFGPACGCRFHPTCSVYAAEAVRTHGAVVGAWYAARRLLKCHPFHPGGLDPVPPAPLRRTDPVRRLPECGSVPRTHRA